VLWEVGGRTVLGASAMDCAEARSYAARKNAEGKSRHRVQELLVVMDVAIPGDCRARADEGVPPVPSAKSKPR